MECIKDRRKEGKEKKGVECICINCRTCSNEDRKKIGRRGEGRGREGQKRV